ncbi:Pyruvate dehydrogenase E1 component subunit beta [Geobacillus sp. BCO2]|nr:Pyruvate dehydrogenase E1 component subunit beta [Geobacillus sp. BCO2]
MPLAAKVAAEMEAKGVSAEVIDLRCLQPLDLDAIIASVEKTGRVMIVHEAVKTGGFGAEVAALISERALFALSAPSCASPATTRRIRCRRSRMIGCRTPSASWKGSKRCCDTKRTMPSGSIDPPSECVKRKGGASMGGAA